MLLDRDFTNIQLGDKVVVINGDWKKIGEVTRITKTLFEVTLLKYGWLYRFRLNNGREFGNNDAWHFTWVERLTPELEQQIIEDEKRDKDLKALTSQKMKELPNSELEKIYNIMKEYYDKVQD